MIGKQFQWSTSCGNLPEIEECERGGEFGTEDCWLDEDHMRISYCETVGDAAPENSFGDDAAEQLLGDDPPPDKIFGVPLPGGVKETLCLKPVSLTPFISYIQQEQIFLFGYK